MRSNTLGTQLHVDKMQGKFPPSLLALHLFISLAVLILLPQLVCFSRLAIDQELNCCAIRIHQMHRESASLVSSLQSTVQRKV